MGVLPGPAQYGLRPVPDTISLNLDHMLCIKTNPVCGGAIKRISFQNIQVGKVGDANAPLNMEMTGFADPSVSAIRE